MRLGTETNSVINHLMSGHVGGPVPTVGMGLTVLHWTDRSAGTIVRVSPSGKTFWFTDDTVTRTDSNGMSESQDYTYTSNPASKVHAARLTTRGWKSEGHGISVGYRRAYHDYSF